jgi:hypothetical protein
MPERRPRLRRTTYVTAVALTSGAFALSLAGIARTEGQVQPNGHAAAVAKKLQQTTHGHCHKPPRSDGREV